MVKSCKPCSNSHAAWTFCAIATGSAAMLYLLYTLTPTSQPQPRPTPPDPTPDAVTNNLVVVEQRPDPYTVAMSSPPLYPAYGFVPMASMSFRQIGILTPNATRTDDRILPLLGRPLRIRRNLWNYYTVSNQNNMVRLPLSVKGKSAMDDRGVDELYNGDTVFVEGYNDVFKVTIYDNSAIRYSDIY